MSSADVNIDEALARDLANLEKLRKDVIEAQERLAFPPEPVAAESSTDALKKVDDLGSELEKIRADLKKAIENKGGVDDNSSQLIKENNKLNEQLKALQFKAKRYYDEVTRFREQSGPQPKKRS